MDLNKYNKAFLYLNHALKIEYRDPLLWSLLGQLYTQKAATTRIESERVFNSEKSAYCCTKAVKYESLMPRECLMLIKLIPRCID